MMTHRWQAVSSRGLLASLALLGMTLISGCRTEMYDQPRAETFEVSRLFEKSMAAQPLVVGTVARGWALEDTHMFDGRVDGLLAETFPFDIDQKVLERGRERYEIYCSPCHSSLGDGDGMIVRRGFPKPPTFHSDRLRQMPVGHYFEVMTRGYGAMYSYAARIHPKDRWAIAAYIRVLQESQNIKSADLPAEDRNQLQESAQ